METENVETKKITKNNFLFRYEKTVVSHITLRFLLYKSNYNEIIYLPTFLTLHNYVRKPLSLISFICNILELCEANFIAELCTVVL